MHPENAIILASTFEFLIVSFKKGDDEGELKKKKFASEDLATSHNFATCTLDTSINSFKPYFLVFYKPKVSLAICEKKDFTIPKI